MTAILGATTSTAHRSGPDSPEAQAGERTLLAVTVAALLLLTAILGLWSVEPTHTDCAGGSTACDATAPLVPVGPR